MRRAKRPDEKEVLKNQLVRALADYDNLRKRVERERDDFERSSSGRVLLRFLSILDMLESAQEHLKDSGLAIVIGEFKKIFAEEGLEEIRPKKEEAFDPKFHEAVETIRGEKKGRIAETVLPGWHYKNGKILRVAKVKVFGEKIEKKEELEKEIARGDYM